MMAERKIEREPIREIIEIKEVRIKVMARIGMSMGKNLARFCLTLRLVRLREEC